jgi:UDP-N-acetylmuramate--alanine ligase
MLATTLKNLGADPSFLIGTSDVAALGDAGYFGGGEYFVVEADEYVADVKYDRTPKFLYQHPFAAIVTNIDFDHPDVFGDLDEIKQVFKKFAEQISRILCFNGDDTVSVKVFKNLQTTCKTVTFGESAENNYSMTNLAATEAGITFEVSYSGNTLGSVSIPVLGRHNALNALAVISLVHSLGFEFEAIASAISTFTGSKRRLELVGKTKSGALVIDDYGHHPTEIQASLSAIRASYQDRKIVCIFQPHTLSRTKALIDEFVGAFENADEVLLLPIFASAREGLVDTQAQQELYERIVKNGKTKVMKTDDVVEYCTKIYSSPDTILVTMGAGDVYKISEKLIVKS